MANMISALPISEHWKAASALTQTEPHLSPLYLSGTQGLLADGIARGIILEAIGAPSSGKTSFCLHIVREATRNGEVCAVVDLLNNFHPESAAVADAQLERILWVRCQGNAEHAMRSVDLLLHAGGFGVVLLNLAGASPKMLNRIPTSYWYRFRQIIEHTPTILLLCSEWPQAQSAGGGVLKLQPAAFSWTGTKPFSLLRGLETVVTQSKLAAVCSRVLRMQTRG